MFEILSPRKIKIKDKIIELPCSIMDYHRNNHRVIEFGELIVVNFYPYTPEENISLNNALSDSDANIWAFDQDGNLVWQVQSFKSWVLEKFKNEHKGAAPFTYVSVQDGKLVGGNWAGSDLIIDPKNGKILGRYPDDTPRRPW